MAKANLSKRAYQPRNSALVDRWSFVHAVTSFLMTIMLGPIPTLIIVTLWEPFEIFVLSPLLGRLDIVFGHESLRNSLSDIAFNSLGVSLAILFLAVG